MSCHGRSSGVGSAEAGAAALDGAGALLSDSRQNPASQPSSQARCAGLNGAVAGKGGRLSSTAQTGVSAPWANIARNASTEWRLAKS